ncbi:MAG: purine/pyrimidine permease, partial [Clostridiaceae bacterium]|nr:purine/pyrimidine permease [Clostridiaceae bacterium]
MSGKIKLNFGVDEKPPLGETLLYGMQWLAIGLPMVVVLGQVVASHNFSNAPDQVVFMQKLFFVTAVSSLLQLFIGHRLPAVIGPAAILVVGITSSQGVGLSSIYTSIMIGGALLTLLCLTGLFSKIEKLFTRQIIAVILLLIALTLVPTILNLISSVPAAGMEFFHFVFALVFIVAMFMANRFLKGMWKSTMIIWAMIAGSIVYVLLVPEYNWMSGESLSVFSNFFSDLSFSFSLDIGVLISFIICFVALSTNDLGSIQAIGELVNAPDMGKRLSAGINVTGLSSVIAGFLGVPG